MSAMLPVQSDYRDRDVPWVTIGLVVLNVLVFLFELALGDGLETFIQQYATVPCEIVASCAVPPAVASANPYLTLITSMFLHGGWLHLLGNMLYLWVFGQNLEDIFGHAYYLVFYLVCGIAANLAQVAIDPHSSTPGLGASGAIAGVLGAYLVLFPLARVRTLVRLGFIILLPTIPAYLLIGGWFILQVLSGMGSLGASAEQSDVAYWAHIGGFVFGLGWAWLWRVRHEGALLARQL